MDSGSGMTIWNLGSAMTIDLLEPVALLKEIEGWQSFLQGSPPPAPSVMNSWRYLAGALSTLMKRSSQSKGGQGEVAWI